MYAEDKRFTEYYDKEQPGMAAFFRDAILIHTGMNKIRNRLLNMAADYIFSIWFITHDIIKIFVNHKYMYSDDFLHAVI